jgi:hypothetical protein
MARPALLRLSLLASLALCLAPRHAAGLAAPPPILTAGAEAAETLTFFATADWGGQEVAPYTTPLQVEMAGAMGRVSASLHPKFIISAGGNFLPAGMPGARRTPRPRGVACAPPGGAGCCSSAPACAQTPRLGRTCGSQGAAVAPATR